jgi:hypothetical protein
MWDARDDVVLTEAERKVLAELEATATRRIRPRDVWSRVRARPYALLIVSVVALTVSLCLTTLTFASSLLLGTVGSLLVLISLTAVFDSSVAFADARERRRAQAAEQLRRGIANGGPPA